MLLRTLDVSARIDAHHHLWDLAVRDQPWIAGPALAPLRRTFTVEDSRPPHAAASTRPCVVQTVTVPDETPDLLALAAEHALIAGVVGWVDLTAAEVADALAALRGSERPLVGIRHQVAGRARPGLALPPRRPARPARGRRARASSTTC